MWLCEQLTISEDKGFLTELQLFLSPLSTAILTRSNYSTKYFSETNVCNFLGYEVNVVNLTRIKKRKQSFTSMRGLH